MTCAMPPGEARGGGGVRRGGRRAQQGGRGGHDLHAQLPQGALCPSLIEAAPLPRQQRACLA